MSNAAIAHVIEQVGVDERYGWKLGILGWNWMKAWPVLRESPKLIQEL